MMERNGRRLAVLSGLAASAVLASGLVFWKDLLTEVHLGRLRASPGYLKKMLGKPEGSPETRAVRRYLKTEEGKQALAEVCLEEHLSMRANLQLPSPGSPFDQGVAGVVEGCFFRFSRTSNEGRTTIGKLTLFPEGPTLAAINPFLGSLTGRKFRSEGRPGLLFSFVPALQEMLKQGFYVSVENHRSLGYPRTSLGKRTSPPHWFTARDQELLAAATALLIEPDPDQGRGSESGVVK
jgi:hypothetical protein